MEKNREFNVILEELQKNKNSEELMEYARRAKEESKKATRMTLIFCAIVDAIIIAFRIFVIGEMSWDFFGFISTMNITLVPMLMVDMIIVVIFQLIYGKEGAAYNKKFKEIGISTLIDNFYYDINYVPDKCLPESVYKEANYRESYDRYHGDDYLEAKIDNKYKVTMANLDIEREEEETDSDGHKSTTYVTVFSGIFSKVELDKSINTEVRIMQNGAAFFNKKQLKMDSSEFEKTFDIITENQIVGMQLLTPDVMEKLLEFKKKMKMSYDVVIKDNIIYFRFMSGPMFEVKKSKTGVYDEKSMKHYYDVLKFTNDISKEFIDLIHDTEV